MLNRADNCLILNSKKLILLQIIHKRCDRVCFTKIGLQQFPQIYIYIIFVEKLPDCSLIRTLVNTKECIHTEMSINISLIWNSKNQNT